MDEYKQPKRSSTIRALCEVDANGTPTETIALIGTERELLEREFIVPRYANFTDCDVDDDNYLFVFPDGKVVSCGTIKEAVAYLDDAYSASERSWR